MSRIVLAVGLLSLCAGAVVFWLTREDDQVVQEPERVALPTPAPPAVQPLRQAQGQGVGWSWVNPRPRAMPSWSDAEMAPGQDFVAMVGTGGRAARFDGAQLRRWDTGVETDLNALAFVGPAQAIAVGDDATVVALLQSGARQLEMPVDVDLRGVAAVDTLNAVIVGDGGTMIRLRELQPEPVDTGKEEDLLDVTLRGESAFVVGARGLILQVDAAGAVTVEREARGATLRAIGGCDGGDLYAAGDQGTVYRRNDEGRWRRLRIETDQGWTDIACDRGRAAASGEGGQVLLLSGDDTVVLESGDRRALRGVAASSSGESPAYLVGDAGIFAKLMTDRIVRLSDGPTLTFLGLNSLGGALIGVGLMGRMARSNGRQMLVSSTGVDAAFAALAPLSDARLIAVGDGGQVMSVYWDRVEAMDTPGDAGWRDVVAENEKYLAVGTEGSILRGDARNVSLTRAPDAVTLWAVAGTPNDAIAVGDRGTVLRLGEAGLRPVECPVTETLRGVVRESGTAWAVGDEGVVVRIQERCVIDRAAGTGPTLHAVGIGPQGRPLAVGEAGTVVERDDAGQWAPLDLGVSVGLRVVYRGERDVFIGGGGGAILQHPRLDR